MAYGFFLCVQQIIKIFSQAVGVSVEEIASDSVGRRTGDVLWTVVDKDRLLGKDPKALTKVSENFGARLDHFANGGEYAIVEMRENGIVGGVRGKIGGDVGEQIEVYVTPCAEIADELVHAIDFGNVVDPTVNDLSSGIMQMGREMGIDEREHGVVVKGPVIKTVPVEAIKEKLLEKRGIVGIGYVLSNNVFRDEMDEHLTEIKNHVFNHMSTSVFINYNR